MVTNLIEEEQGYRMDNNQTLKRCAWVINDPINISYHDKEWGKPIFKDRLLFEYLNLEGMQAGLSWQTILKKRSHMRRVFDDFNAEKIICYDKQKIAALLNDPGIIRSRLKIAAIINNAKAYLAVRNRQHSFADYIWRYVDGRPVQHHYLSSNQIPSRSSISERMAKDLKKDGFKFIGSTICYAFMQAVGMVNDHTQDCFRYHELL